MGDPAEQRDRLRHTADHQERHGHQPRRYPLPGHRGHPHLQSGHFEHRDRAQSGQLRTINQLGCSISHGAATTPHTATSYLFVAGVKGGLFSVKLDNVTNPTKGGEAGKTVGPQNYYSAIPENSLLTSAAVSANGQYVIATSMKRLTAVYACFNPLGDPGSPTKPINPKFFVPPAAQVHCMQVGSNNMPANLTTTFGPDSQPYFGGRRVVMSFNSQPGGPFTSAWPECISQNSGIAGTTIAQAFANPLAFTNGCGLAQPNFGFTSALVTQPSAMITHGHTCTPARTAVRSFSSRYQWIHSRT